MSDKPKDKPASYYKLVLYRDDGTCEMRYELNADPALVEKMIAYSTERPESPEWSGQGLPPAGIECEYLRADLNRWVGCTTIGVFGNEMVCAPDGGGFLSGKEDDFRPIKSGREWDGEGLPPVGTVCEVYEGHDEWVERRIVAHDEDVAIYRVRNGVYGAGTADIFRPIKSGKEKQVEAAMRRMKERRGWIIWME